jgi:inorganic phosphate transporter, PiT family
MGAGIAAAGFGAVNWPVMGTIAASWVVSPVLGGIIAALLLAVLNNRILSRQDKVAAARTWVPVMIGLMGGVFATYMALKGMKALVHLSLGQSLLVGLAVTVPLILADAADDQRPVARDREPHQGHQAPVRDSAGVFGGAAVVRAWRQ